MEIDSDLFLFLPNSDDNIAENGERIREFSFCVMGRRVPRSLIAGRIDQRVKERQRLAFFADVIKSAGS